MTKRRILLIDDEPSFTRLLRLNLEKTGTFEVREENQGKRGLPVALEFKPDLIVLDVIMPDIDGGTVASQLKNSPQTQNIPILFLTAILSEEECQSAGGILSGRPCVIKPASATEISSRIEDLLKGG